MTAKYLRKEDYDKSIHWITAFNLRSILTNFPVDAKIEIDDLSNLLITVDDECIGYISMKDGYGYFISYKSVMDDIEVSHRQRI
jgi:hypothetical protein